MVNVTILSGLGAADPSSYFDVSRQYDRTLRSGATQAFFSDRSIYESTLFTTQTDTSYLGHVIVAPNGKLGFDPDAVITGTVDGSSIMDFVAAEIADGKSGQAIWEDLLGGDDTIRANDQISLIHGYDGDDVLVASPVTETSLRGDAGDDVLIARPNFYSSYGGDGADMFVVTGTGRGFQPSIAKDFNRRFDTIALDSDAFGELGGKVTKQNFVFGAAAIDGDDRLIVSNASRVGEADVFFDRDGSGPAAQVLIGHVDANGPLRRSDFEVIDASRLLGEQAIVPAHGELAFDMFGSVPSAPSLDGNFSVHCL